MKNASYLLSFLLLTGTLAAQPQSAPETPPRSTLSPPTQQEKPRSLPYRGSISKIDREKGTFTIKNKSNDNVRLFKTDDETRFEQDGKMVSLKELTPNQAVSGSCIKTGDREYLAKLVRWKTSSEK